MLGFCLAFPAFSQAPNLSKFDRGVLSVKAILFLPYPVPAKFRPDKKICTDTRIAWCW